MATHAHHEGVTSGWDDMQLTLSRLLKCLLTAVAAMWPPCLVINALISSLVTRPEACTVPGSVLTAGEGVGSLLTADGACSSVLMVGCLPACTPLTCHFGV